MLKRNRIIAVTTAGVAAALAAGVFVALGVNSVGTAKSGDRAIQVAKPRDRALQVAPSVDEAQVTGYAGSALDGELSGPVSVVLHGASAARIDQLIKGLPVSNPPGCMESAKLFQIKSTDVAGAKQGIDVAGDYCAGFVFIISYGKTVTRIDRNCALTSAVRRLLPATATATQRGFDACQSGSLASQSR